MNIYFLVEGKRTERIVYPKWLKILIPQLTQIKTIEDATSKCYYLFSGEGYPSLLHNHLKNAIEEINENKSFEYLVICLDADESAVNDRINDVQHFMQQENLRLIENTKLIIIVQNRCFETWFLGNRKVFKRNPSQQPLMSYVNFFNVQVDDPEKMLKFDGFETTSQFHHSYLKAMLFERNIFYSKNKPADVSESHYLEELIERVTATNHLETFKIFLNFCEKVSQNI